MPVSRPMLPLGLALLLVSTATAPAHATYPGGVGDLAFGATVGQGTQPDIYAVAPDGSGDPERLTDDPGFDACAAYDATGTRIAFCSGRTGVFEIWTMDADGSNERQLTHLGGLALFPDFAPRGHRVAFAYREPGAAKADIWTIRDDGRHPRQLTHTPEHDDQYPAYSPDGRRIAFMRFANADRSDSQLWLMDRHGRRERQLTFDSLPKDQLPDWSPDGKWIAYEAGRDIWLIHPDGSGQVNITNTPLVQEYGAAWSPDGSRLAYLDFVERKVYTMRPDGNDRRVVAPGLGVQFVPGWQPLRSHRR